MSSLQRFREPGPAWWLASCTAAWLLLATLWLQVPLGLAGFVALLALLLGFFRCLPVHRPGGDYGLDPGTFWRLLGVDPRAGIPSGTPLFIGHGGRWRPQHSAALHACSEPSQGLVGAPGRAHAARQMHLAAAMLERNALALGAPGTGKSTLLVMLAWQAQARGEAVVVIDPKGSLALRALLAAGARRAGVGFASFTPAMPSMSARYDLFAHCQRASDHADRLCALLGSDTADPFRDFCWGAVATVCEALLALGEAPTLTRLRELLPEAGHSLLRHHGTCSGPGSPATGTRWRAVLPGLRALAEHDRTHFRKMTAPLLPLLELLAGGERGPMLSRTVDPGAPPGLDLWRAREQGLTVYLGLDALGSPQLAQALGRLILDDLARCASHTWAAGRPARSLRLLVDEAGEVACDALLRLLGKGREAGVQVLIAVQTLADLEWRLGSASAARVAEGNAAAWFLFRQLDALSRNESEARLGNLPVDQYQVSAARSRPAGLRVGRQTRTDALARHAESLPRIPAATFAVLRDLECLAHLPDGGVYHLRLPRLRAA